MQSEQLWEYFVVAGLPKVGLQTVQGDAGFLGTDQKYKPVFVDSLPHSTFDESCHLPPQLPTVSVCVCPPRKPPYNSAAAGKKRHAHTMEAAGLAPLGSRSTGALSRVAHPRLPLPAVLPARRRRHCAAPGPGQSRPHTPHLCMRADRSAAGRVCATVPLPLCHATGPVHWLLHWKINRLSAAPSTTPSRLVLLLLQAGMARRCMPAA